MRPAILIAAFACFIAAAPTPAAPRDRSGARAFVEHIYAGYPRRTPRSDAEYYALFAPELRALIRRNDHYSPDEVGPLDGDPFCQCQDDAGLHHRIVSLAAAGSQAKVAVRLSWDDPAAPRSDVVTYKLVRLKGAWKIADIGTTDQPSLKDWLRVELAKPH